MVDGGGGCSCGGGSFGAVCCGVSFIWRQGILKRFYSFDCTRSTYRLAEEVTDGDGNGNPEVTYSSLPFCFLFNSQNTPSERIDLCHVGIIVGGHAEALVPTIGERLQIVEGGRGLKREWKRSNRAYQRG